LLVTNGAKNVSLWADSPLFGKVEEQTMPVSAAVGQALKQGKKGDSTGCGDNFAGGVIGSIARQMASLTPFRGNTQTVSKGEGDNCQFDLKEACRWGIVSGGFACFYYGGTYLEGKEGEKLSKLQELYEQYLKQEGAC
jgi:sugar/nucleoside kinase (ribokinase family)